MASFEFLAIVIAALSLAASIIHYSYTIRNQTEAIRAQIKADKRKVTLDLLNRQITFYSDLDGRLDENDARKVTDPLGFIDEKFKQANVASKYNDLALEKTRARISNYYTSLDQTDVASGLILQHLLQSVYEDLEYLREKRDVLLSE
jgi:hypothetical protein